MLHAERRIRGGVILVWLFMYGREDDATAMLFDLCSN